MRRITIVGGGLAGLALGILLRQRGVPVEIWEAYDYPRHRVCGEFISGKGWNLLQKLLPEISGRPARNVSFYRGDQTTGIIVLPEAAMSLDRWTLDHALAERFKELGGDLRTRHRWTEDFEREGLVRASGRILESSGRGWIGLKLHIEDVELDADLEMHFSRHGYAGLSRLAGPINVCGLLRPGTDVSQFRQNPLKSFEPLLGARTLARLQRGRPNWNSLCATTGISFKYHRDFARCVIGDAHGMIPPFTGNGMSLAIESGFLAAEPMTAYGREEVTWTEARQAVDAGFARQFRRRFATSRLLRGLTSRPWTQRVMLSSLKTLPRLLPLFFRLTR